MPRGRTATVCEAVLLPGDDAVLAPAWVPWEERLRPGDIGPGDVLPFRADDPRLEPGFTPTGDPEVYALGTDDQVRTESLNLAGTQGDGYDLTNSGAILTIAGQPVRSGGTSQQLFVLEENDMTFRPLHDRILVRRIEAEEKTAGGIIIPDTAKEKPSEGEVIAVGSGRRDENGKLVELDVKVGDRILFGKWSGTEIKLNGEDLLIMKESDVMGVIETPSAEKKAA